MSEFTEVHCPDCQTTALVPAEWLDSDGAVEYPHTPHDSGRLYPRECESLLMVAGA